MKKKIVFVDNNATTSVLPGVVKAMKPFFTDIFYNASSTYSQGQISNEALKVSRETIAKFLGVKNKNEIIFTGSATESANNALRGVLAKKSDRKHIITTSVEHPCVYELCHQLLKEGYEVTFLDVDENGELNLGDVVDAIRPDTAIVSIMHANNETGVVFPIEKLSKLVKMTDPEIVFHTDATQTVGKLKIDLNSEFSYVDMLTFSGHKIYAPKGIGVLWYKKGVKCTPLIIGGHQEGSRRAGTENVPYIVGLGKAISLASKYPSSKNDKQRIMRDKLEEFVKKNIPEVKFNGEKANRLGSTSSISFYGIEGESIVYGLNEFGICVSTGSACSSANLETSYVLQAMKLPIEYAHGTIRFSFGRFNTEKDLKYIMKKLPRVIDSLRGISPFWDSEKNIPK